MTKPEKLPRKARSAAAMTPKKKSSSVTLQASAKPKCPPEIQATGMNGNIWGEMSRGRALFRKVLGLSAT